MTLQQMVDQGLIRPHIAEHIQKQAAAATRCSRAATQIEKTASVAPAAAGGNPLNWKLFALAMGAASAIPLAETVIREGGSAAYLALTKSRDYDAMMKATPDLKHMDKVRVQQAFNTLRRFAPDLSRDPLVAGTWAKRNAEYDMVDHRSIGELISANRGIRDTKKGEFNSGVGTMLLATRPKTPIR